MGVPIRTLAVAGLMTMLTAYFFIGFAGSFEVSNHLPINQTLADQYNAIIANTSFPGGSFFGGVSNLSTQTQGQASTLKNTGVVGGLLNSIGLIGQFIGSLPSIYGAITTLVAIPISAFVPTGYAIIISNMLLLLIVVLAILSAIFLFPV